MHRRGPIGPVHLHGQLQRLNRNRAIDRSKLWPVAPLGQRKQLYCNWAGHILPGQLTHQLAWWNTDETEARMAGWLDRKSTRLNSSHLVISYAVFCLKKKK